MVAKQPASSSGLHFSIEEQIVGGVKITTRLIDSGTHDQEEYPGGGGCSVEVTLIAHKGYSRLGALQRFAMILTHTEPGAYEQLRASSTKRFSPRCDAGQSHCKPL